jgi:ferric-dicitrate binding protein FerR (iron transport regulator)
VIRTPYGLVRERGTQFEARLESGRLRVRVREGEVGLERSAGSAVAEAGEELAIRNGLVSRGRIPVHGRDWDWVLEVAAGPDVEGATLRELLSWVTRETHRPVRFQDERAAGAALSIRLHGSIRGLTPDEALAAILPTCGLVARLSENEVVLIGGP